MTWGFISSDISAYFISQSIIFCKQEDTGLYYVPRSQKVNLGEKYFIGTLRSSWQTFAEWNGSLFNEASEVGGNYPHCPFNQVWNAVSSKQQSWICDTAKSVLYAYFFYCSSLSAHV